jgi:nicotinate dehydrogenase subunit B
VSLPQDRPAFEYWSNEDVLLVYGEVQDARELYIAVYPDGSVTAFNGHVDLGTGIRTSLAQIVAEELNLPFADVTMVLGSTAVAPNQGATIASETIQITAVPLRQAAATAREFLLAQAAERIGTQPDMLLFADDASFRLDPNKTPSAENANIFVALADLIKGRSLRLPLDPDVKLKPVADYTIVGQRQPRTDIPQKATGEFHYVHDVRVPGMAHGRVVRPPYAGFDAGPHIGHSLISVDESSVADIPGLIGVVVLGDFVGVIAEREEHAIRAMKALKVVWRAPPLIPDLNAPEIPLRNNRSTARVLTDKGDVETTLRGAATSFERSYVWPYQMHGSIGPSCAVADWHEDHLVVWSGTQNPFSWTCPKTPSSSSGRKPPAAMDAIAPTMSPSMQRCCRARSNDRCAFSSRASRSTPGSRKVLLRSSTSAAPSMPKAAPPLTTSRRAIRRIWRRACR